MKCNLLFAYVTLIIHIIIKVICYHSSSTTEMRCLTSYFGATGLGGGGGAQT